MRRAVIIITLMAMTAGAAFWAGTTSTKMQTVSIEKADIVAGEQIYRDYCAACHGANLEGQENWRSSGADGKLPAPPHNEKGHTWHHSDQILIDYTTLGGTALMAQQGIEFASGMPGFGDELSDTQIHDVLAFIKSTWPERIQKIQAERTKAEGE